MCQLILGFGVTFRGNRNGTVFMLMRNLRYMALVVGMTNFFWLIVRPSLLRMSERAKKELCAKSIKSSA